MGRWDHENITAYEIQMNAKKFQYYNLFLVISEVHYYQLENL